MSRLIASRQVEIEHTGNGWLSSATAGLTPGQMCRAKLVALGIPLTVVTLAWGCLLMAFGVLLGTSTPIRVARWVGYVIASLASEQWAPACSCWSRITSTDGRPDMGSIASEILKLRRSMRHHCGEWPQSSWDSSMPED